MVELLSEPLDYLKPGQTIIDLPPPIQNEIRRTKLIPFANNRINQIEQEEQARQAIYDTQRQLTEVAITEIRNVAVALPKDNGSRPQPPPPPKAATNTPSSYAQNPEYIAATKKVTDAEKNLQKAEDELAITKSQDDGATASLETVENEVREYEESKC